MVPLLPFKGLLENIQSDPKERFYIYEVIKNNASPIRGLVCLIPLSQTKRNSILRHEEIYLDRRDSLLDEFMTERIQKNPILFITEDPSFKERIQYLVQDSVLVKEAKHMDGTVHRILRIMDGSKMLSLVGPLCIADGHHRYAALMKYYRSKIEKSFMMGVIFDQDEVVTRTRGIIVKNGSISFEILFEKLAESFTIKTIANPITPSNCYEYPMFFQNSWQIITLKPLFVESKQMEGLLGIEIFKRYILQEGFRLPGYANSSFVKMLFETCNIQAFTEMSWENNMIGFLTAADLSKQIIGAAKKGRVLEPNSTYFEPKLINRLIGLRL